MRPFLHLFAIITLYSGVWELISMLFHFIDLRFPGSSNVSWGNPLDSIRWSVATLVFVFPAYVWAARFIVRDLVAFPQKTRRWIVRFPLYLTIFIGGMTLISDLICLLYYFLKDDLTMPFVLKVASVLMVIGTVFSYYLYETRQTPLQFQATARRFAIVASILVVSSIIAGFAVSGRPLHSSFSH